VKKSKKAEVPRTAKKVAASKPTKKAKATEDGDASDGQDEQPKNDKRKGKAKAKVNDEAEKSKKRKARDVDSEIEGEEDEEEREKEKEKPEKKKSKAKEKEKEKPTKSDSAKARKPVSQATSTQPSSRKGKEKEIVDERPAKDAEEAPAAAPKKKRKINIFPTNETQLFAIPSLHVRFELASFDNLIADWMFSLSRLILVVSTSLLCCLRSNQTRVCRHVL